MHRRRLLILSCLAALPLPALGRATGVGEVRVGAGAARVRRIQARLGISVFGRESGLVAALNAGHLELALLSEPELGEARRLMGQRLLVLRGRVDGRVPVTRSVLPPALRAELAAALA